LSTPGTEFMVPWTPPGRSGDRVFAQVAKTRKVRTPESTMPDNVRGGEFPYLGKNLPDRATEIYRLHEVRVKRWCKRLPARVVTSAARQPPSGARPSRDNAAARRI